MTTTDTEIVQAAGNFHHQIRQALYGQAEDIFDHPTPFDPRNHVFDHHTHAGEEAVEQLLPNA